MLYLPLVSRGVVGGLCLVAAKYCYDRIASKQTLNAAYGNGTPERASDHTEHLQTSTAAIDVKAATSTLNAAAVAETTTLSEDKAGAKLEVLRAGNFYSAVEDTAVTDSPAPITSAVAEPRASTTRQELDDDQRVEEALASGDLLSMDMLLEDICDPVLRHHLMNRLVRDYYRLRSDSKHRTAFYRVAYLQIEEAPSILDGVEETGRPRPRCIEAFKSMAIALDEDGLQETAIAVCEIALSLSLHDGTKSGFKGRISRLKKRLIHMDMEYSDNLIH